MTLRRFLPVLFALGLAASPALAQNPSGPATPAPYVHWRVVPSSPCPGDSVALVVEWCERCVLLVHAERTGPTSVRISTDPPNLPGCASDSCPTSHLKVQLGAFPPGPHAIDIELVVSLRSTGGGDSTGVIHGTAPFTVRDSCGTGGGGGGVLPFIDEISIHGPGHLTICPGESIKVNVFGTFPDNCHRVRRAELIQPVCVTWPCLPFIRILVDDFGCVASPMPCSAVPVHWSETFTLPPLPTGDYRLVTQLGVVTCSDSFPDAHYATATPFKVATPAECGNYGPCVALEWKHSGECTAVLDSSGRGSVVLREGSQVPISGLQGRFRLSSSALRIQKIEAIGPAAGMLVSWSPTPDGANWLMFAKGSPLPPTFAQLNDILRVGVGPSGNGPPPARAFLELAEWFGSDSVGTYVAPCPRVRIPEDFDTHGPLALLCEPRPCDANRDGHADVRDLVLMVRCLHSACADSADFDCNVDGDFGIDDVLCCARRILHRDTHDTTGAHPAPDVHATLGAPRETESGWVLPVRITGTAALGGARLEIAYPSDRFTISGMDQAPGAASWLSLWDTDGGALVLGLINTVDPRILAIGPDELNLEVRLALRPGSQPGGSVAITAGEYSSPEGAPLLAPLHGTPLPIVTPARLALSSARPNPFSTETSFSLDLEHGSQVEVTVHDLSGRRVATVMRGALPAGRHTLQWNGATERGGRAPEGLYFVKCLADGRVVSQKVAILRQK